MIGGGSDGGVTDVDRGIGAATEREREHCEH
jgi:hypothetical protein